MDSDTVEDDEISDGEYEVSDGELTTDVSSSCSSPESSSNLDDDDYATCTTEVSSSSSSSPSDTIDNTHGVDDDGHLVQNQSVIIIEEEAGDFSLDTVEEIDIINYNNTVNEVHDDQEQELKLTEERILVNLKGNLIPQAEIENFTWKSFIFTRSELDLYGTIHAAPGQNFYTSKSPYYT